MTEEKKLMVVTKPRATTMRGGREQVDKVIEEGIPLDKLQRGFESFMDSLSQIVQAGYDKIGNYTLDEISFSAEIGAEGEFKLLGTGVGVSGSAGVTFKLHRQGASKV